MNIYQLSWVGIIVYCMIMYVVLDGFTLGTGMLLPFLKEADGDIAMSTILPTWDGNQTWLVLSLASLYGAFPLAFSLLMPALYLLLLTMGVALLFRGVAFEFRLKSSSAKYRWSVLFGLAALVCAFIQGVILGIFIHGFTLNASGDHLICVHYLTSFSVFTAVSLVIGYLLLGSTRLILKTEGHLRAVMYRIAPLLTVLLSVCLFIVSVWTPFINPFIANRWFNLYLWPYLVMMPTIMSLALFILIISLVKKVDQISYWAAVVMFLCPYAGFCVSVYPYVVPYHLFFWQAASGVKSLKFMFFGACVMLPVLTAYTYYSYHVFRGKVIDVLHY